MEHEKFQIDKKTGELKLVNTNFIQFYENNIELFLKMTRENSKALEVFWWVLKRMDEKNALVVSQQALADALKVSRMTIHRASEYLKNEKILTILKSGNTSIYVLNSEIVWKNDAESKKYAHFTAKVYITGEEQDIDYQTKLFGHAIPKNKVKKVKMSPEEAVKGFEGAAPSKQAENASQGLKIALNHPLEVQDLIEKGYKFVEETENAYEMENSKGILTIFPKK
jgi:DNA-binding transcriptional regulator YhcF (GntR family)